MAGNYLLDTNILVAILNQEPSLGDQLKGSEIFLPSIVLGELYFGAQKSTQVEKNLKRIQAFVVDYPILNCDGATASQYGLIKQHLSAKGKPIPDNDIWIAAVAQQYGLTLVTRDEHFSHVDGLKLEKW